MRVLCSAALVLLGACTQVPQIDTGASQELSLRWLIGGWVPEGESCESDAGVRYNGNGTWVAYEAAGTWRIEGPTIVSIVTERWADGAEVPVTAGKRHVERIEVLGPNTYQSRWQDGTVVKLRRCTTGRH
jgi:hypothetical protein